MKAELRQVIRKVQDLRKLAASSNVHEATAAAAAAARLMQEYRLDDAAVAEQKKVRDVRPLVSWGQRRPAWQVLLADFCCKHFDVAYLWIDSCRVGRSGRVTEQRDVRMYGVESDVELTRKLFAWLKSETLRLGKAELPKHRSTFRLGMAYGLERALTMAKAAAFETARQKGATTAALALRDRYEQNRREMYEEQPPEPATLLGDAHKPAVADDASELSYLRGYAKGITHETTPTERPADTFSDNVRHVDFASRRRGPFKGRKR